MISLKKSTSSRYMPRPACSAKRSGTPASARRMAAMAAQAALSKKGVAVLILPLDISKAKVDDEPAFAGASHCASNAAERVPNLQTSRSC